MQRILIPAMAFVLLMAVSVYSFQLVHRLERGNAEDAFQRSALNHVLAVKREYEASIAIVDSVGTLFDTGRVVTEAEFNAFVAPILRRNPAIQALGWVPRVPRKQRATFEAQAQAVHPGFAITDRHHQGEMRRAAERPEFFPVRYIEPSAGNEAAVGFDLASDALRRTALLRAARTGDVAATPPIILVQETGTSRSVLLTRAIYQDVPGAAGPARRADALAGFASAVLRADQLIAASMDPLAPSGIDFQVTDITDPEVPRLLAEHWSRTRSPDEPLEARAAGAGVWTESQELDLAGRRLHVALQSAPGRFTTATRYHWVLLLTGALLAAAVTANLALVQRTNAQNKDNSRRLERLTRQLLDAQEAERRSVARELHEEMGQQLTALKINLHAVGQSVGDVAGMDVFDDSNEIVDQMLNQIRNLCLDLRPTILDDLGLDAALRWYLRRQTDRAGLGLDYAFGEDIGRLPETIETVAFRVVQESVTNAIRHARATRIGVAVSSTGGVLDVRTADDGAGFDVETALRNAGLGQSFGLLSMYERVHLAAGRLDIRSTPGAGTQVHLALPL